MIDKIKNKIKSNEKLMYDLMHEARAEKHLDYEQILKYAQVIKDLRLENRILKNILK